MSANSPRDVRRGSGASGGWFEYVWRFVRPVLILTLSVMIILGATSLGWNYINERYLLPVSGEPADPVVFEIESGSSLSAIARNLEAQGLVRSHTVFRYYVDFQGLSGRIKAGAYNLSPAMTMDEIAGILTGGGAATERTITLIEGWTCRDMADYLAQCGALTDAAEFLTLCDDISAFDDYYVINEMLETTPDQRLGGRSYALEGYLAPDTYDLFLNESAESIIKRLLAQSEKVISAVYSERDERKSALMNPDLTGETLDDITLPGAQLTMDELFTLASLIEKEARPDDFARVSAVFHNRLLRGMPLESCATVQYALGTKRLALTAEDLATQSPYNTYMYVGLPVGPICNPSKAALMAAAFPDEDYLNEGYLYFCSKEPDSGELIFSKTREEHEAQAAQYRPSWVEYDRAHGLS